jgi:phosphoglycolate phosphatase-like HAD superfamily hydrolase
MSDFVTRFEDFQPSGRTVDGKRVAAGIDIDGCVDPGMYKHETGFALASIFSYGLQMVTPMAMRAWMYVNCYSESRGITRFKALYMWADILRETPSVQKTGVDIPQFKYLRRWADITPSFSPEALYAYLSGGDLSGVLKEGDDYRDAFDELYGVLQWSNKVNSMVPPTVENMDAFPNAAKAIRRAYEMGVDICAVSGTPEQHVVTQLEKYGILDCFTGIFAQQAGKKNAALVTMMVGPGWEDKNRPLLDGNVANYDVIWMMGDAPKDYSEAQKANKQLTGSEDDPVKMFLLQVGRENESWELFDNEVLDQLVAEEWSREDEQRLIQKGLDNLKREWTPGTVPIETFPLKDE